MPNSERAPMRPWLTLLILLIGALVSGVIYAFIAQDAAPLGLTPAAISLGGSVVISYAIWQGRIRGYIPAFALGILMVALLYSVFHIASYFFFRIEQINILITDSQNTLDYAQATQVLDEWLLSSGSSGLLGYLRLQLQYGMVVTSTMPVGPSQQITGPSLIGYWLIDIGILLAGTLAGAWFAVRRPFCETCGRYYGLIRMTAGNNGLEALGWVKEANLEEVIRLFKAGHLEQAGTLITAEKPAGKPAPVFIERCPTCATTPIQLFVVRPGSTTGAASASRLKQMLSQDDFARLTTFSADLNPQPAAPDNRWLGEMTVVCAFLCGALLLFRLVPTF